MALNLSQTKNFSLQSLKESKIVANTTNGGFDEATWGKLDVTKWQGSVQDGVYQLTNYTGDSSHIIIPNEADFEKAGKSTNGLQVGITSDTARSLLSNQTQTIAFSKTDNQKVKAIGTDWSQVFSTNNSHLSKFDGSSLDVSSVTNMRDMFYGNKISDLTSLAHWDVSSVTTMSGIFLSNQISDLTPLAHWDTSNVTNMSWMFEGNKISDLTPLANWNVRKVTDMSAMFWNNQINDLSALAHWNTSKVTDMSLMFYNNSISDLTPLTNWDTSKVTDMSLMFYNNSISDLTPLTNWKTSNVTDMSHMFEDNKISDLKPLTNWNTSKVTDMSNMFDSNSISNLTPLTNWDTSKVTDMSYMFARNPDLIDLRPIANWNISGTSLFYGDSKLNLTNVNNTPLMQVFLKQPNILQGADFITNNAGLVKATTGKDLPDSTNTAKRTITFNLPHVAPKTIVQIINYKAITPVQIYFNPYSDSSKIVQTYPVKESDWQLDTSKQNDDVIIDGMICFKPVKIPHINGYKAHLIKDPVNPNVLLVSFIALPQQSQNNQLLQKPIQAKQNQSEPIQTKPANDKQTDQIIDHISYTLMHDSSNVGNFEPVQNDPVLLEAFSNSTQKDDVVKPQKVNVAKAKKHIVKKHAVKKHKRHAKKYYLRKRSRKHAKRVIKHRKRALRKFRRFHLKRIKRVKH